MAGVRGLVGGRGAFLVLAFLVLAFLWIAALVLAACSSPAASTSSTTSLRVLPVADREPAPVLSGELLDGTPYDQTTHTGDVIVVNFWGSWCPPCVAEADDLEQTYQATKDSGVAFVGVNVRDTRAAASQFVAGRSTYPSIFDPESRLALGFAVPPTAIPSTVVIDRQGRVAMIVNGAVIRTLLEPVVAQIAAEPA